MGAFDPGVKFSKTGAEAKAAIAARLTDLGNRLARRNADLESLMNDKVRLRSFLVRDATNDYPHNLQLAQELPSEDHQQITELCQRIHRIEKEMTKLSTIRDNLKDDQQLELDYDELLGLGFGPRDE
jgi:DNA repair exonuclease SbcCD ATPase subunit